MLTGVFDLLIARQNEFDNYQNYIKTIQDYWITRAQIQRVVGGRLPPLDQMDKDAHSPEKSKKSIIIHPDRVSQSISGISSQNNIPRKQDKK